MRVLVGCEYSGRVRDAFAARGHDAWSCDIEEPSETPGNHVKGDVLSLLGDGWDLAVFHPPCTYLTVSGLHWNTRDPLRAAKTDLSVAFVRELMDAPIPRIALENPVGCLSTKIKKPSQTVQPYEFGEDASKKTCLWLKGLPLLHGTERVSGRMVEWPRGSGRWVERWGNQTDSGQNKLAPSATRWKDRSRTYLGIAAAMAAQWG